MSWRVFGKSSSKIFHVLLAAVPAWVGVTAMVGTTASAWAGQAASCGGAAMLGGAQLNCSHIDPKAPTQACTFSWALLTIEGSVQVVEGSFLLPPGSSNATVYQGAGFNSALSNPIVLCQGKKSR